MRRDEACGYPAHEYEYEKEHEYEALVNTPSEQADEVEREQSQAREKGVFRNAETIIQNVSPLQSEVPPPRS